MIEEARQHPVAGKESLALYTFATATDLEGNLLPIEVAAVDLLNIIRPTVAFNRLIAFDGTCLLVQTTIYQALKQKLFGVTGFIYSRITPLFILSFQMMPRH